LLLMEAKDPFGGVATIAYDSGSTFAYGADDFIKRCFPWRSPASLGEGLNVDYFQDGS
jgi:hypothetical protein